VSDPELFVAVDPAATLFDDAEFPQPDAREETVLVATLFQPGVTVDLIAMLLVAELPQPDAQEEAVLVAATLFQDDVPEDLLAVILLGTFP